MGSVVFPSLFPSSSQRIYFSFSIRKLQLGFFFRDYFFWLLSLQALACFFVCFKHQLGFRTSAFVIPTDESDPVPARPSDHVSASGANIRSSADVQPLATNSSQSGKRRRHWLDLPEDDNSRRRKLFSEDSALRSEVGADLLVALSMFSGAIADAISHERSSLRRSSPACEDKSHDAGMPSVVSSRVPRLTVPLFSAPERSARMLPPVTGGLVVPFLPLVGLHGD